MRPNEEDTLNFSRVSGALIALSVPLSLSMGAAYAGENTLEFQLVVKYLEPRTLDASNIEDQAITQAKGFGVAVFKDGRIGTKDFIMAVDKHKDAGTGFGYSTYKFEDGSIGALHDGIQCSRYPRRLQGLVGDRRLSGCHRKRHL